MDDFVSESDSDYTSYWRDWVSNARAVGCGPYSPSSNGEDVNLGLVGYGRNRIFPPPPLRQHRFLLLVIPEIRKPW